MRVQLQNVYKVDTDDDESDKSDREDNDASAEENNDQQEEPKKRVEQVREPEKQVEHEKNTESKKTKQNCYFCVKMKKKIINHSHAECETLRQIHPGLMKNTNIPLDTSDSEEEELGMRSSDDESVGSTRSLSSHNEHDDNNDDATNDDKETDEEIEVNNKDPSPPRAVPSFTWSTEMNNDSNLPMIEEKF